MESLIAMIADLWRGRNRCEERFGQLFKQTLSMEAELLMLRFESGQVNGKLDRVLAAVTPLPAARITFNVMLEGHTIEGATKVKITDTQKFTASIQPVDAKGNPAAVQDGSIQWSGPGFLSLAPSSDGLSCDVVASGPLGSGQVEVSADADLGDGVVTIGGGLEVEVVAGRAVSLAINTGAPVEQV